MSTASSVHPEHSYIADASARPALATQRDADQHALALSFFLFPLASLFLPLCPSFFLPFCLSAFLSFCLPPFLYFPPPGSPAWGAGNGKLGCSLGLANSADGANCRPTPLRGVVSFWFPRGSNSRIPVVWFLGSTPPFEWSSFSSMCVLQFVSCRLQGRRPGNQRLPAAQPERNAFSWGSV